MARGRPGRLSAEAVREIREWYERWTAVERPKQMAYRYGVHKSLLTQIGEGLLYKEVPRG